MLSMNKSIQSMKISKTRKVLSKKGLSLKKGARKNTLTHVHELPDEIWMEVFKYLDLQTLLTFPRVCHKWRNLSNNETLWQKLFEKYANISPFTFKIGLPAKGETSGLSFWKSKCLKYFILQRNKFYLSKLKKNLYTGTTSNMENLLKNLGVKFQLCIETLKGEKHFVNLSHKKLFSSSLVLQWNSLNKFPEWKEFKSVSVYGLVPVLFKAINVPLKSSPKQKSLLINSAIPKDFKILYSDKKVTLIQLKPSIFIALWQETSDVAFVLASIHHHQHIEKLLRGSEDQLLPTKHLPFPDDIDPRYGLHGYECHLHLHTINKTIWEERFTCLGCELSGRFAEFNITNFMPLCKDAPKIVWKTDLFNGTLDHMGYLAVTMTDSNMEVMWNAVEMVAGSITKQSDVDFLNSSDEFTCTFSDNVGFVSFKYKDLDTECNITKINIGIEVARINNWFNKNY